jgi:hypothetical protein
MKYKSLIVILYFWLHTLNKLIRIWQFLLYFSITSSDEKPLKSRQIWISSIKKKGDPDTLGLSKPNNWPTLAATSNLDNLQYSLFNTFYTSQGN